MARLLSVNVGLPRDIEWKGRTARYIPRSGKVRSLAVVESVGWMSREMDKAIWPDTEVSSELSSHIRSNHIAIGRKN